MDTQNLTRHAESVIASLRELPDKRLITLTGCKIYAPVRFSEKGLVDIAEDIHIVGICAIVLPTGKYGVSMVNAMWRILPSGRNIVTIHGDDYYEFIFEPGSTVVASVDLVKTDVLVYRIYSEILSKGNVPWYLNYQDLGKLFNTARYHTGANIGGEHEVTEMLVSMISRDPENRARYYRQRVKTSQERASIRPVFVPMNSVSLSATNTTNKLAGSRFSEGVVSALVTPSDRVERIEALLSS